MLNKRYYTQKEVADLVGVNPGIISYWEEKLRIFRPKKRGGRKLFTGSDLKKALMVKQLLDSGLSLRGVKKKLEEEPFEELLPEVISGVIEEIKQLLDETVKEIKELRSYINERNSNWNNTGNH
ncbi:MAG: helix-turn-helix domain-containing protein [Candidatus Hydrothermia bacterium]